MDKAIAEIEASPSKTLPKPKLRQFPGMNLGDKEVAGFWERINFPQHEKILPLIKTKISSNAIQTSSDQEGSLLERADKLLSAALSEREDAEIADQAKT